MDGALRKAIPIALILLCCGFLRAAVKTDGTLGAKTTLPGPHYTVDSRLGQLRGGNLFHSFSQLDVAAGQSLTFTGPRTVTNILVRVTGGRVSTIDGSIDSTIPGANLFLISPTGFVFGPRAVLNVTGSVLIGADQAFTLAGGGRFDAQRPQQSVLTSARPDEFGFVRPRGTVRITGSRLSLAEKMQLHVDGRSVFITNADVGAPSGPARFFATSRLVVSRSGIGAPGGVSFSSTGFLQVSESTVGTRSPSGKVQPGSIAVTAPIYSLYQSRFGLSSDKNIATPLTANGTVGAIDRVIVDGVTLRQSSNEQTLGPGQSLTDVSLTAKDLFVNAGSVDLHTTTPLAGRFLPPDMIHSNVDPNLTKVLTSVIAATGRAALLVDRCILSGQQSTFLIAGRGGLTLEPGYWHPATDDVRRDRNP